MNLITGQVDASSAPVLVDGEGFRWPLPASASGLHERSITVGIRPEHVDIADGALPGTLQSIEPTGAETHLVIRVGAHDLTVLTRDRLIATLGAPLSLRLDQTKMKLFDTHTGHRIGDMPA